ncbi:DoxX family protein [Cellulomonas triticagri]|uniref:DoxX family protein n=1 Tax=Cellulomonas triticagri TaxID=2483352 RepID=A0A3M2J4B3_9CELL|nr:DoxX family protein [Cellulomonas triticagri]RMI08942.1 DoxX family protein [Cellulomonas triticagri]
MTTTASRPTSTPAATAVTAPRGGEDVITSVAARRTTAALRIAVGFVFLWAFLDKTFGLGYSTASEAAWVNGGTPSQGFLQFAATGPLQDFFVSIASPASDVLFMLGMLGVGLAVVLGIGLRVSAVAGSLIMAMMWLAEWPLAAGSSNPVVDYHVVYAIALVVFALVFAGDTWGLGTWWRKLPIVQKLTWLR